MSYKLFPMAVFILSLAITVGFLSIMANLGLLVGLILTVKTVLVCFYSFLTGVDSEDF